MSFAEVSSHARGLADRRCSPGPGADPERPRSGRAGPPSTGRWARSMPLPSSARRPGPPAGFENPECLKVLTEFTDGEGRTLDRNLATWGMSAGEYVLTLPFRDGAAIPRCRHARIELVTHRGLRPVYVCPGGVGALDSRFARDPDPDSRSRGGHGDPRDAPHPRIGREPTQQPRDHRAGSDEVPLSPARKGRPAILTTFDPLPEHLQAPRPFPIRERDRAALMDRLRRLVGPLLLVVSTTTGRPAPAATPPRRSRRAPA